MVDPQKQTSVEEAIEFLEIDVFEHKWDGELE